MSWFPMTYNFSELRATMWTCQAALISSPFVGALMAIDLLAYYSISIHGFSIKTFVGVPELEVATVS